LEAIKMPAEDLPPAGFTNLLGSQHNGFSWLPICVSFWAV